MSLPAPDATAAAHSARLSALIQQEIAAQGGWLSFARFMELALYAPGLGYYSAGAHKLGAAGDFTTAPELSQLFGRTLARQVQQVMQASAPQVLELGAGSGKLAEDLLDELEKLGSLPSQYAILEVSPDLRQRQQARLSPRWGERVVWLDALPETFSGALVANEVLDALPVHLVSWQADGIYERGVIGAAEGFAWQDRPLGAGELLTAAQALPVQTPYVSEINLAARGLLTSLGQRLQQGALLWIDYGFGRNEYFHPQRHSGTLMCHYRHHAHDEPFFWPGLQDITAHVDFTTVAESAIDAGLELLGYTSQAFFLINCGITQLLAEHSPEDVRDYAPLSAQLQKLTSPAEMGELFKVMALGKNLSEPLLGFKRGDLSRAL